MVQLLLARMQPPPQLAGEVAGDMAEDESRPSAGPAPDQGAQGNDLPMGSNTGPEYTQ